MENATMELDGYGSGCGDGYGEKYAAALAAGKSPADSVVAFWRSTKDGRPANGGSGTKASVGLVEEIPGPLKICTKRALHGTTEPRSWKGSHWWLVALHKPVQRDGDKIGSLKRTFLADLGKCPFSEG